MFDNKSEIWTAICVIRMCIIGTNYFFLRIKITVAIIILKFNLNTLILNIQEIIMSSFRHLGS